MVNDPRRDIKFKSRFNSNWKGSLREVGALNLEIACAAYEETDPIKTHPNPMWFRDKDGHSLESFRAVGEILRDICGWAVDHEVGKAALGVKWQPVRIVQSVEPKAKEEFERITAIVASDDPEILGAAINGDHYGLDASHGERSVDVQRQMLINILHRLNGGLKLPLLQTLTDGLEALNLGETLPLLKPKKHSRTWTRAYCQLQALEYVEFWRAFDGSNSTSYYKHVRDAFDGDADPNDPNAEERIRTARRYKEQAIKHLGIVHVEQVLAMARNCGTNLRSGKMDKDWNDRHTAEYSKERLVEIGRRFRGSKGTV